VTDLQLELAELKTRGVSFYAACRVIAARHGLDPETVAHQLRRAERYDAQHCA